MDDHESLTSGQLFTSENETGVAAILAEAFPQTQVRESSHYSTGKYVLADFPSEVEFFFERISHDEYLVRGECGDSKSLGDASEAIAKHLGQHGIRCRFETYDSENSLVAYAHHDWPLQDKLEANQGRQATASPSPAT